MIRCLTFGRIREDQLQFLRITSGVNQINERKIEEETLIAKGDSSDHTNDKVLTNRSGLQNNEQDPLLVFLTV
jgi:hypothetical protein